MNPRDKKRKTQIIVLGHYLSDATLKFLDRKEGVDNYTVYQVMFHIRRFDQTFEAVEEAFQELAQQGCDLSGATRTYFQAVGASAGAMAFVAAWHGLTGSFPSVLNLIRIGERAYGPSRELPILKLHEFSERVRTDCERYGVRVIKADARTAEPIEEDDLVCDGVVSLQSGRNNMRPFRMELDRIAAEASRKAEKASREIKKEFSQPKPQAKQPDDMREAFRKALEAQGLLRGTQGSPDPDRAA